MKKSDFIELVKTIGEYSTKAEAEKAINAFTESISTALEQNNSVSLIGFGSFTTVLQRGKSGKIPGTNRTYTTQDKQVPKFKAGANLRERVEKSK